MIDDFQVPHDPGYGFDDYGPMCGRLTIDFIEDLIAEYDLSVCFPAFASVDETGSKRGCVILASEAYHDISGLDSLCPYAADNAPYAAAVNA